eukprot:10853078-Lingulodinium_polyedra.AAC.1
MAEDRKVCRDAEGLIDDVKKDIFQSATDWVVELSPGAGFRYACPYCKPMPVYSCHWRRLSHVTGLGGSST